MWKRTVRIAYSPFCVFVCAHVSMCSVLCCVMSTRIMLVYMHTYTQTQCWAAGHRHHKLTAQSRLRTSSCDTFVRRMAWVGVCLGRRPTCMAFMFYALLYCNAVSLWDGRLMLYYIKYEPLLLLSRCCCCADENTRLCLLFVLGRRKYTYYIRAMSAHMQFPSPEV